MDPLVVREILRSTSTRMGPASQPEYDPHWNEDFGWGLVDTHDAVWTSEYLAMIEGWTLPQWSLQVHIENVTETGSINTYTGIAWTRGAALERSRILSGWWRDLD